MQDFIVFYIPSQKVIVDKHRISTNKSIQAICSEVGKSLQIQGWVRVRVMNMEAIQLIILAWRI